MQAKRELERVPEFEQRLALLTPEEQDEVLDLIARVVYDPLAPEEVASIALGEELLYFYHGGENGRIWINYHVVSDDLVRLLTCGRTPKAPLMM